MAIGGKRHMEKISHFQCDECKGWWAIGDAPKARKTWFCPWCGTKINTWLK